MLELLLAIIQKYPMAASIFMVMGVMRAVFKPLFSLAEAYVVATPSKKDDEFIARAKQNKVVTTIEFVLDYIASIKLPK